MEKYLGQDVKKLGFGFMRLPTLEGGDIDIAHVNRMVDHYMEAGFTYFDTAYGYMGGRSEETIRRTVVERYPREKFQLATKLPLWELKEKGDAARIFSTQLERTGAGYFDYYLLHAISGDRVAALDTLDTWGFMREMKAKGLVKHIGFSFHDKADVLDSVLTAHPELEFVQLQINYADWEDKDVQARACYETALKHGKPVIVMEPVKGGALAAMTDNARAPMEAARPGMSPASWAMRFCASLDKIVTVLSGMSNIEQVEDNVRTMASFEPLTDGDRQVIAQVKAVLDATPTVPCTDCRYCIEKCPSNIPIPAILKSENSRRMFGQANKGHYGFITSGKGKASACVACGVCESRCPQHIEIIGLMRHCAEVFEG